MQLRVQLVQSYLMRVMGNPSDNACFEAIRMSSACYGVTYIIALFYNIYVSLQADLTKSRYLSWYWYNNLARTNSFFKMDIN